MIFMTLSISLVIAFAVHIYYFTNEIIEAKLFRLTINSENIGV